MKGGESTRRQQGRHPYASPAQKLPAVRVVGATHANVITASELTADRVLLGDARGRLIRWKPGEGATAREVHHSPIARIFEEEGSVWTISMNGVAHAWDPGALEGSVGGSAGPGALTNLRVCWESGEVVPVVPFPPSETVWAPQSDCGWSGKLGGEEGCAEADQEVQRWTRSARAAVAGVSPASRW